MYLRLLAVITIVSEGYQVLSQQDALVKEINTYRKMTLKCTVSPLEVDWDISQRAQMLARSLARERNPFGDSSVPIDSSKEKLVYRVGINQLESPMVIIKSNNENILQAMEYDRIGYSYARGCNGNAIVIIFQLNEKAFQDYFTMIVKSYRAVLKMDMLQKSSHAELDSQAVEIANSALEGPQNFAKMEFENAGKLSETVELNTNINKNEKGQLEVKTVGKWKGSKYDLMKETIDRLSENGSILDEKINQIGFGYAAKGDLVCTVVLLNYGGAATTITVPPQATVPKYPSWPKYSRFTFFFLETSPFSQMYSLGSKKDQLFMANFMPVNTSENTRQLEKQEEVPSNFFETVRRFRTCEHWMMAHKAIAFHFYDLAVEMLKKESPVDVKRLGRSIEGFKDTIWDMYKIDVVKRGNFFKFGKNKELFEKLKATKETTLVEVNPDDTIWGIGLARSHPNILHPEKWEGINLLGEILVEVRNNLPETFDESYEPK